MRRKILFSNLGYARGIDGSLWQHISRARRHVYCGPTIQQQVLAQLKSIIAAESPDLCCFVEIDQGSIHSGYFNQIMALVDDKYRFFDIAGKYGHDKWLGRMPMLKGKSNAFLSRQELAFERLYFTHGAKKLVYRIRLPDGVTLLFAHFSLKRSVRAQQLAHMRDYALAAPGEVILLADFNIMGGFGELAPLLRESGLRVLNREDEHTFAFHRRRLALDLCICSETLAGRLSLKIIRQPYSDHAALLVEF